MASAFSHAAAAVALATAFRRPSMPARFWVVAGIGAVSAALPDLDVLAFPLGIPYSHMLGHRGLSHSFAFAAFLATAAAWLLFPRAEHRKALWLYLFLATASHGLLDACTNGGLGVAFFAPFSGHRYFFPWTPIQVSPVNPGRFFTARGLAVIKSELVWIWLPALLFAATALAVRRKA